MKSRLILLPVLALALLGVVLGPIGAKLLGFERLIDAPAVHLAPQKIFAIGGFTVTNTLLSAWLTCIVILLLFGLGSRRMAMVPGRLQGFLEMLVEALYGFIKGMAGERYARRWFPLLATIFVFVAFNAWMALLPIYPTVGFKAYPVESVQIENAGAGYTSAPEIVFTKPPGGEAAHGEAVIEGGALASITVTEPGSGYSAAPEVEISGGGGSGAEVTAAVNDVVTTHLLRSAGTDINMPLALALIAFVFIEVWGFRVHRFGYLKEFFRFGNPVQTFIGLLELISHFIRIISFTFRLFGNMLAGEIVLFMMTFLTFFVTPIIFYGLEILVGGVQALVFMGLTLVFAVLAVAPHEGHKEEHVEAGQH